MGIESESDCEVKWFGSEIKWKVEVKGEGWNGKVKVKGGNQSGS